MGKIVLGIVGEKFAGTQVEGAIAQVEQIRIGIQGGMGEANFWEGAGEAQEGMEPGQGFAAGEVFEDTSTQFGILVGEAGSVFEEFVEGVVGQGEHGIGVGGLPVVLGEEKPATGRDVAEGVREEIGEAAGVAVIGKDGIILVTQVADFRVPGTG
jgi:hypothetical protein